MKLHSAGIFHAASVAIPSTSHPDLSAVRELQKAALWLARLVRMLEEVEKRLELVDSGARLRELAEQLEAAPVQLLAARLELADLLRDDVVDLLKRVRPCLHHFAV